MPAKLPPIETLVIATHNTKKAVEMIQILAGFFPSMRFRTLGDYPAALEPDETGSTYAENATAKAIEAAAFTGQWALADDAGLEIDALDGKPGLHSRRFAGEETPFPEKMAIILDKMREVPEQARTARFRCCVALAPPGAGTQAQVLEATCEGRIAIAPKGSGGFGYDPIFFLPELGRTMAELTPEEKHAISHRGKVLRMLADHLRGAATSLDTHR